MKLVVLFLMLIDVIFGVDYAIKQDNQTSNPTLQSKEILKRFEPELNSNINSPFVQRVNKVFLVLFEQNGATKRYDVKRFNFLITTCLKVDNPDYSKCNNFTDVSTDCCAKIVVVDGQETFFEAFDCDMLGGYCVTNQKIIK